MTDFTMTKDGGIATIIWDVPGKSMNVMSFAALDLLDSLIDDALADSAVRGIIITSAKADFAAGMDLNVLAGLKEAAGDDNPAGPVFDGIMRVHQVLREISLPE